MYTAIFKGVGLKGLHCNISGGWIRGVTLYSHQATVGALLSGESFL